MYFSYQNVFNHKNPHDSALHFCFLLFLISGCHGAKKLCGSIGTSHLIWNYVLGHFCLKISLLRPTLLTGLQWLLMLLLPLLHMRLISMFEVA